MPKNLNITSRPPVQGIASIGGHLTLDDFTNVIDPLAVGNAGINKPASSIPSMFARMKFFKTAYQSVAVTPTVTNTVYAKYVSDSLDLLEDLFNRKHNMELIPWNKTTQLAALNINPVLRDALSSQMGKFIPTVEDIILVTDNNKVIGGTSPFTIVYTSPNWNNNRPVQMLVTRTPQFREYMYRLAAAFSGVSTMKELVKFIDNSRLLDPQFLHTAFAGQWTPDSLYQTYPPYQLRLNTPAIIDPQTNLQLCGRDTEKFSSDFFLDSTVKPFNEATTPLFLTCGLHPTLNYYDGVRNTNILFTESENDNGDEIPRTLPNCTFSHRWISPIYLLEDNLLKVPYQINSQRWANVFEVEGSTCLVPLKPMFFKYFKIKDVNNIFRSSVDVINKKILITLDVPVRNNDGTRRNTIRVAKEYSFEDIKTIDDFSNYFTIGVSPFYRSGKHFVLRQEAGSINNCNIEFFNVGETNPIDVEGHTRNEQPASRTTYYEVNADFDYIRVFWPSGSGVLIPIYKPLLNGNDSYYYGVDFGTTNTHIAYTSTANTANSVAQSFNVNEFTLQVEFLSAEGKTGEDDGVLLTDAAREFLPSNHDNGFSFPIRTVVSNDGQLNNRSKMFNNVSIGFRYSKEYTQMSFYHTELKWDFDSQNNQNATIQARVRIFCEELLWIIKNHWKLQPNANHENFPEIRLTYPKAMLNWPTLKVFWENAYEKIFNINPILDGRNKIDDITESLAPCKNVIVVDGVTSSQGILNIDMGGGTTDFQYYCDRNNQVKSIYCSVRFAGDDLWGKGYEHTGSNIGQGIRDNAFTRFADAKLRNAEIIVGSKPVHYTDLSFSSPKDKIDCLLKDTQHNFVNALRRPEDNACRKIMYVHYASILWHVAKWLKANGVDTLPLNISFTGLASKYLDLLFDTNDRFVAFTKKLLSIFSGHSVERIVITRVDSPKNITAEGAALYAYDSAVKGTPIPGSEDTYHLGYDNYTSAERGTITFDNVSTKKYDVLESLKKFLEDFNTVGDCDGALHPQQVIRLTQGDIDGLLEDAKASFDQMCQIMTRPGSINDSLFFWALKDSLWKIGTH